MLYYPQKSICRNINSYIQHFHNIFLKKLNCMLLFVLTRIELSLKFFFLPVTTTNCLLFKIYHENIVKIL